MALQVKDATNTTQNLAVTTNGDGSFTGQTILQDPTTATNLAGVIAPADALSQTSKFGLIQLGWNFLFNGTTWDRQRAASGTVGVPSVNIEGTKATYSVAFQLACATNATDAVTLVGSGTKTVRVTRVKISGVSTAATLFDATLFIRTAADTGGTSTTKTPGQHDSTDGAPTAVVNAYTVNPTPGTGASIRFDKFLTQTPAGTINPQEIVWEFGTRNTRAVVLRGTAQALAINFNGSSPAGLSLNVVVEWTEE